ncbi:MAG: DUF2027 domain-containing protein [Cytophagaceae bacterium]
MKPGDKVRFKHSKDEGIVRKINSNNQVEVEISDGFLIPALKSELVIVASEENKINTNVTDDPREIQNTGGIYLAFTPFNDRVYSILLINTSDLDILYSYGELNEDVYNIVTTGSIKNNSHIKVGDVSVKDFDNWPQFVIQYIFYKHGRAPLTSPGTNKMKIKAASFFKNKKQLPVVNTEGHLFQIDSKAEKNSSPVQIVEEMFSGKTPEKIEYTRPEEEVDLHIEKLVKSYSGMGGKEILDLQLKTFEKHLENAMASGMEEITFIHGAGNGVLKTRIHEILSRNREIVWYKEARKEKFGYGATLVRLKN